MKMKNDYVQKQAAPIISDVRDGYKRTVRFANVDAHKNIFKKTKKVKHA